MDRNTNKIGWESLTTSSWPARKETELWSIVTQGFPRTPGISCTFLSSVQRAFMDTCMQLPDLVAAVTQFDLPECKLPNAMRVFQKKWHSIICQIYQQVSPHIAVAEVAMPVDCWGKLLHPLDLPQQLSHLDFPVTSYSYLDYPVTSAFLSFVWTN